MKSLNLTSANLFRFCSLWTVILAFAFSNTALAEKKNKKEAKATQEITVPIDKDSDIQVRIEPSTKKILKQFSPAELSKKSPAFRKLLESYKVAQAKGKSFSAASLRIGGNFLKQVPAEVLAFYTAQFATTLRKLVAKHDYESQLDDPRALGGFFEHLKTPSGYVGFVGFMAANRSASGSLMALVSFAEKAAGANASTASAGLSKKLVKGSYGVIKGFVINSLALSAGMAASSVIEEFWHDEDVWACSELTLKSDKNSTEEHQMIRTCEKAYEKWTFSRKMFEWTPHFVSLALASGLHSALKTSAFLGSKGIQKVVQGNKSLYRMTVKGFHFLSRNVLSLVSMPVPPALGVVLKGVKGVATVTMNLVVFMEIANILEHLFVHDWQKSGKANRLSDYVSQLNSSFKDNIEQGWNPSNVKETSPTCQQAESAYRVAIRGFNPWAENCQFDGPDFLSRLKRFSYFMSDFRSFQLGPFMSAADNWQKYLNQFVTIGTASTQIYPAISQFLQPKQGRSSALLTPVNNWIFLDAKEGTSIEDHKKRIQKVLSKIENSILKKVSPEQRLKNFPGSSYREKLLAKAAHIQNIGTTGTGKEKTLLQLWQMLLAADSTVTVDQLPVVELFKKSNKWPEKEREQRETLLTHAFRLIKNILTGKNNDAYPLMTSSNSHPDSLPVTPSGFLLLETAILQSDGHLSIDVDENDPKVAENEFFQIYRLIGKPWPVPRKSELFGDAIAELVSQPDGQHKQNWGSVSTEKLSDYLLMGMICGPELISQDTFQNENQWIGEAGPKTPNDYSVSSRLIRDALGFKTSFVPPRLTSQRPDQICDGLSSYFSPRPHQIYFEENGKKYFGAIDYLAQNVNPKYVTDSGNVIEEVWMSQVLPAFEQHFENLKKRYQNLKKDFFFKPYLSQKRQTIYSSRGYVEGHIELGIRNLLNYELDKYLEFLKEAARHTSKNLNNSELETFHQGISDELRTQMTALFDTIEKSDSAKQLKEKEEALLSNFHALIGFHHPRTEDPIENSEFNKEKPSNFQALRSTLREYEQLDSENYKNRSVSFILDRMLDMILEVSNYYSLTTIMNDKENN